MSPARPLEVRFREALCDVASEGGGPLVVALSGGLDSVVLLHLLRFHGRAEAPELVAAHFDHAMRPCSAADARWVAGLCRAWGVPLRAARAEDPPASEAGARDARYAFLEQVARDDGARAIATAHHADDQAETVLFRILRGTGPGGLSGIPGRREPGLLRPLLGFWREELAAYASSARIGWRADPSNRELRFARNAIRERVLPDVERLVAPGARRALVRLADLAREDEEGWESLMSTLLATLDLDEAEGAVWLSRDALAALHPAVRGRVIRWSAARLGATLDRVATRLASDFAAAGSSGGRVDLGRSVALVRELDRVCLRLEGRVEPDRPLTIPDAGPGTGTALLAGREVAVSWGAVGVGAEPVAEAFDARELRFPLRVRARAPGDRIRLAGGTKKVKKLLLERRVPSARRSEVPLVVDAEGDVLWIPGIARSPRVGPGARADALRIAVG